MWNCPRHKSLLPELHEFLGTADRLAHGGAHRDLLDLPEQTPLAASLPRPRRVNTQSDLAMAQEMCELIYEFEIRRANRQSFSQLFSIQNLAAFDRGQLPHPCPVTCASPASEQPSFITP